MKFKNQLIIVIWGSGIPLMLLGYFMVADLNDCTTIEPGIWKDQCYKTIERGQFMAISLPMGFGLFLTIIVQVNIIPPPQPKIEDKRND
jgi:hypothetical protein